MPTPLPHTQYPGISLATSSRVSERKFSNTYFSKASRIPISTMKDPTSNTTTSHLSLNPTQARSTNLYTNLPRTMHILAPPHPPDAGTTKCPSFTFLLSRALTPGSQYHSFTGRKTPSSLNEEPLLPCLTDLLSQLETDYYLPLPQHRGIGHIATRRAEVRAPLSSWCFSGHGYGCGTSYRDERCSETCDFQIRIRAPLHENRI
jgi:hypothetical protein